MNHYLNCENAKKAVAKVVTFFPTCSEGKEVYFYGSYKSAADHYERAKEDKMIQLGFERAELYFRGVGNQWIEMVTEE